MSVGTADSTEQIGEQKKNWCVPFGTERVKTERVSKSEDVEKNPNADSHPDTNQA
jgi:hypothetical protein